MHISKKIKEAQDQDKVCQMLKNTLLMVGRTEISCLGIFLSTVNTDLKSRMLMIFYLKD